MHAVNNLMQGPYYSDFADVALAINEPLVNVLLGHVSIRMVNIVLSQHGVQLLDADCQLFICALGHIDWPLLGYGCLREVAMGACGRWLLRMELLTVWGHGQDLPRIPLKRGVSRSVGFGRLGTRGALSGGVGTTAEVINQVPHLGVYAGDSRGVIMG